MAAPAAAFLSHLETSLVRAQAALHDLDRAEPTAATLPAARSLRRGIGALLDAYDHRSPRRIALGQATATLAFSLATLGEGELEGEHQQATAAIDDAVQALSKAQRELDDAALDAEPPSRSADFHVSAGAPRLHHLPRSSLRPPDGVALPPPDPPPFVPEPAKAPEDDAVPLDVEALLAKAAEYERQAMAIARDLDERAPALLAAAAAATDDLVFPPGAVLEENGAAPEPLGEAAYLRSVARDLLEDIGMYGVQRFPLFGDDWVDMAAIEQRLFVATDALAGFGAAMLPELERFARDAPAPDPMRAFGLAFALGSIDGRDGLATVERVARLWADDEDAMRSMESALALAPSPLVPVVLRSLATAAEPGLRAAAIGALARRGAADLELLVEAVEHPDPRVVAAALPPIGATRHAHAAAVLSRAQDRTERAVKVALWEAHALLGSREAAELPLAALATDLFDLAALALGVAAHPAEARALADRATTAPTPALFAALGWAGQMGAVPLLIEGLADDALALAAALALHRILGSDDGMLEDWELDPESTEALEPRLFAGALDALAAELSDEDEREGGSPDHHVLPTRDQDAWTARRAHVQAALPRSDDLRARHGAVYTPHLSLAELGRTAEALVPTFWERQLLQRELCLWSGRHVHFDARDLVPVQRSSIEAWRAVLGGAARR